MPPQLAIASGRHTLLKRILQPRNVGHLKKQMENVVCSCINAKLYSPSVYTIDIENNAHTTRHIKSK